MDPPVGWGGVCMCTRATPPKLVGWRKSHPTKNIYQLELFLQIIQYFWPLKTLKSQFSPAAQHTIRHNEWIYTFFESNYTFSLQKAKIITKLHRKNVTRQEYLHPVWKFLDPPLIPPHQKFMAGSITGRAYYVTSSLLHLVGSRFQSKQNIHTHNGLVPSLKTISEWEL